MEVGLEWGLFKDRINGSISFYRNRSSNQLIGYSLPPTTGFPDILSNFPATVQNKGLEILVSTVNLRSRYLTWTTSANFSQSRNKLIAFPDLENSTYATTLVVGAPLSIQKSYNYTGLDSQTGLYLINDINKDGSYDDNDKQVVKFIGINYSAALQSSLTFKGFTFDVHLQYVNQEQRNYLPALSLCIAVNQHVSVMERWRKPGDNTNVQLFSAVYSTAAEQYTFFELSDQSVVDASYLRLKNIYFSYLLSEKISNKVNLSNIRLFIQGQNLLTFTNFIGLDPESNGLALPLL